MYFSCYPNSPSPVCCLSVRNFFQKRLIKFVWLFLWRVENCQKVAEPDFLSFGPIWARGPKMGQAGGRILILDFDFVIWFSCQEWKIIIISSSNPITPYLAKFLFWSYTLVESDSRILLNTISQWKFWHGQSANKEHINVFVKSGVIMFIFCIQFGPPWKLQID